MEFFKEFDCTHFFSGIDYCFYSIKYRSTAILDQIEKILSWMREE